MKTKSTKVGGVFLAVLLTLCTVFSVFSGVLTASAADNSITVFVYTTSSQKGCQLVASTVKNGSTVKLTTPGSNATVDPGTKLEAISTDASGYEYPYGWNALTFENVDNLTFDIHFSGLIGTGGAVFAGSKSTETFTTTSDIWLVPEDYYASNTGAFDVDFLAYHSNPCLKAVDSSELAALLEFGKNLGNNLSNANMEKAQYEAAYNSTKSAYDRYKDSDQITIDVYTGYFYNKVADLTKAVTADKHELRQAIIEARESGVKSEYLNAAIAVRDLPNATQADVDAQISALGSAPTGPVEDNPVVNPTKPVNTTVATEPTEPAEPAIPYGITVTNLVTTDTNLLTEFTFAVSESNGVKHAAITAEMVDTSISGYVFYIDGTKVKDINYGNIYDWTPSVGTFEIKVERYDMKMNVTATMTATVTVEQGFFDGPPATEPTEPATTVSTEPATTEPTTTEPITTVAPTTTEPTTTAIITTAPTSSVPAIEFELGDVNMDGKLNIRDATLIQKYLAKMAELDETAMTLADFDLNGKVNIKDATNIQKKLAGLL